MVAQNEQYLVVVNHEEQYSIWPQHREVPDGWREEGFRGEQEECLSHIGRVWTDMRPLSLRRQMEAWAMHPPEVPESLPVDDLPPLMERLAGEGHRVEVRTRAEDKVAYLRERLQVGYLHVLFPDTRGGTEVGIQLDAASAKTALDVLERGDDVKLSGTLTLDDVQAKCNIRLSLSDLSGRGGISVQSR